MNSFDSCCKIASLVCCLVLGLETLMFGHDVSAQARSIEGVTRTIPQTSSDLALEKNRAGTMLASEKVTGD